MRTNIVIDDELLNEAMRLSGLTTKRAVVEEGLRKLIRLKNQEKMLHLPKNMRWEGNLDESRLGPFPRNPRSSASKTKAKQKANPGAPLGPRR
jgi:Arc/MetJ family transcription regulator